LWRRIVGLLFLAEAKDIMAYNPRRGSEKADEFTYDIQLFRDSGEITNKTDHWDQKHPGMFSAPSNSYCFSTKK
jgi:hypothetical protein